MIWAFSQVNIDYLSKFTSGKSDFKKELLEETKDLPKEKHLYQFKRTSKDTFKLDSKGLKEHEDRMQNGFRLFGLYFSNLWD
jgi:hypothetical protein